MPARSLGHTIVALPRNVSTGMRVYRSTPRRLRKPDPAVRAGVSVVTVWFSVLFVGLGVLLVRASSSGALHDTARPWVYGYFLAGVLGPVGLTLFLSRRYRAGLSVLGSMFLLVQLVTVAAIW